MLKQEQAAVLALVATLMIVTGLVMRFGYIGLIISGVVLLLFALFVPESDSRKENDDG